MKATGIVRRIEARVIITQKSQSRINTRVFAGFCPTQFAQNPLEIGFGVKKAKRILHIMMPDMFIRFLQKLD